MNAQSVAHSYVQKQQNPSWSDDPFELKVVVKGVTNMNHKRNLEDYAQELVAHFAKYDGDQYDLDLTSLPDDEQNELARLYIEATGRETSECVYGDDFTIESDFTCALLSMLKDDCKETREHFAEITRKNILKYYDSSLQETLDEACNDYQCNMMNEQGYYQQQDLEHGDFHWRKF